MNGRSFEWTGYVESINVKGVKQNSHQFLFSVVSDAGDAHRSFLLDTAAEPARYTAMVSVLTAAYVADRMVGINTAPDIHEPRYAAEIEVVRGRG